MTKTFKIGDKVVLNDRSVDHKRLMRNYVWYSKKDGLIMTVKSISSDNLLLNESSAVWLKKWLKHYNKDYLESELFEI